MSRRRMMMQSNSKSDTYEGFTYNAAIYGGDNAFSFIPVEKSGYCVSPAYPTANTKQYTVRFGHREAKMGFSTFGGIYSSEQANYVYEAQYADENTVRSVGISNAKIVQFKVTFLMSDLDNCYIYCNTDHEYVWKGKNVT